MNHAEHIAALRTASNAPAGGERLQLPDWSDADWNKLLDCTQSRAFRTSEMVIKGAAIDRALYFVVAGTLEVGISQVDGVSISTLAKITAGSVIGEQSFFDGQPRSANVWAVSEGELLRLDYDDYTRFGREQPALARDLLFAVARVLSTRLRNTTFRVRR